MSKYTPEQWHASQILRRTGDAPGIDIGSDNGANIAIVHFDVSETSPQEVWARARLIAAAPDLLEELKRVAFLIEDDSPADWDAAKIERLEERVNRVIAKATEGGAA